MPDDGGRLLDRRWVLRVALVLVALPFLLTFAKVATADDGRPPQPRRRPDRAPFRRRPRRGPSAGRLLRALRRQPAGSVLFWLLALPAAAGPLGIAAAVLLVGYGAVAGMLAVAARRGGALLVCWTALLSMVLVLGRGLDRLADPWEPMLTVLLVALAVMAVWEVASGTVSILPGVVALLWFLASVWTLLTSVAVAVGVVLVAAVAVVARDVVRSGDRGRRRALLIAVGASVAVLVVMVTPTIVEQVVTTPGNLTQLLDAAGSSEPTVGPSGAWERSASPVRPVGAVVGSDPAGRPVERDRRVRGGCRTGRAPGVGHVDGGPGGRRPTVALGPGSRRRTGRRSPRRRRRRRRR